MPHPSLGEDRDLTIQETLAELDRTNNWMKTVLRHVAITLRHIAQAPVPNDEQTAESLLSECRRLAATMLEGKVPSYTWPVRDDE